MSSCEKKFNRPSIREMAILSIAELIIFNLLVYLVFTLVFKKPYTELFHKIWIILIFSPLLAGILQPVTNRNGQLILNDIDDPQSLRQKLAELLAEFQYTELSRDENSITYNHKLKWERTIFKGKVVMTNENGSLQVFGKKNMLDRLETKMVFGKEFKEFKIKRKL